MQEKNKGAGSHSINETDVWRMCLEENYAETKYIE